MAKDSSSYGDVLSRRRFVELTGVSGVAALAGCGGDEDGGDSSDGSDGSSGSDGSDGSDGEGGGDGGSAEVYDATYRNITNQVPTNVQFNLQNPNSVSSITHYNLFDAFAKFNYAEGELVPYAITDWEYAGDTFEMTIREGLTWENGDPVTSEDIAVQLRLNQLTNESMWGYTESIDTPDERTVVLNIPESVNPTIVEFDVLEQSFVHQKADIFGEHLEAYESGDEDEATRQFQDFAYQDVVASGPWTLDSAGQQQFQLSRREDHPDAENINFSNYVFQYIDGNQQTHQALINLDIDAAYSMFTPPEVVEQIPDVIEHVTMAAKWGFGLAPNHAHEHAGDRAVRQAISYVINRQAIVDNVGDTLKTAPAVSVGIPTDDQERWLGDAMDEFESYGVDESMHDEAAAVLEEAGYEQDGNTWVDENGNAVELPVTVPTGWTDWVTAAETAVDQLSEFGFQARTDSRSFDSILGSVWPNGDFVLAAGSWLPGGGQAAFAYFSLYHQLVENVDGLTINYPPANSTQGGENADVTVPDMDGNEMTVNPSDRLEELSQTTDEELIQEIVTEQAWVTNVELPIIPVIEKLEQSFLGGENWDVPDADAPVAQARWPSVWLPRHGELSYAGD
ncbi:ABC transporter substrate-binding protein [Halomicrobium urmianum]|uniref:ABC transporter substrate-binding protein n=1 Tax=Halomicrobium urmianum TaxID=1586233 RepID=UPI001CDA4B60|nr:ABC transporter substrate-binding protein [Halomicrobium urmianum]